MARLAWRDNAWDGKRKQFIIAITMAGLMLILLFLANMSYLYGVLYRSGYRVKALNILAVDFDGGPIGQSLTTAYGALQADSFPTLQFHSATEFPSVTDVRNAVCRGDYWGAIIAQPGASTRLSAALGGGPAAADYHSNNTLTYIYNGARYASIQLGDIQGNLATLVGAAGSVYHAINGTQALTSLNSTDQAAVLALMNPITASSIDIMETPQGTRVLYNSVSVILPIMQQFFFLMALNGINNSFGVYGRLKSTRIGIMRAIISLTYTFISSLTVVGYIWAFREDWSVNGVQFVLSWMTYWLYQHVNFLVLDTVTAFIPLSFVSFAVLTWAIINVSSSIFPFELSPGFFRWGYALPGHEVYTILVQIWSGGCNNQLYRALPILFSWEVVGMAASIAGMFHRNRIARKEALEAEQKMGDIEAVSVSRRNDAEDKDRTEEDMSRTESRAAGPGLPMPFLNRYGSQRQRSRKGTI